MFLHRGKVHLTKLRDSSASASAPTSPSPSAPPRPAPPHSRTRHGRLGFATPRLLYLKQDPSHTSPQALQNGNTLDRSSNISVAQETLNNAC
ncbi:unnamed protein product [Diplocarpon coronariae]|nr:hypothetical protein JHW43_001668 [Diplocarpon mali]